MLFASFLLIINENDWKIINATDSFLSHNFVFVITVRVINEMFDTTKKVIYNFHKFFESNITKDMKIKYNVRFKQE
jgi:rRNA-processing protein FCF1